MTGLVILIFVCTVFAAISQNRDSRTLHHHKKKASKDRVFFTILVGYMVIFAGLRTSYNDTDSYISTFMKTEPITNVFNGLNWDLGTNPGFKIFTSLIRTFTDNPNIYLMICSLIVIPLIVGFVHRYTKNFTLSMFLFFTMGYFLFCLAAIKQTMATALAVLAIQKLLDGKKLRYLLCLLLGTLIHPYCLMYLIAPILMKQIPWHKGTWFMLFLVAIVAYSFNFLVQTILDVTDIMGEGYNKETFVGEGINTFRVMVYFVPVVISFLWRKTLFEHTKRHENLFMNCTIVCALIMFVGMFGNANMFARLAMYFEPPIYVALPWMIYKLKGKVEGLFISIMAYIAYPAYFYYQTVMAKPFDLIYHSMSLGEFFNSLFQ
ncbi:MAG: EpsG family protein [Ruminococcaceae bacterium]|nr:EpsG family protein [Oscillospiraceae bacterium]